MVLVTAGIQAAVFRALESAESNPIPSLPDLIHPDAEYWQLFSETAPLTILTTLIAFLAWPAEQKTRPPRSDRELGQDILHKGPLLRNFLPGSSCPDRRCFVISLDVLTSNQPKLLADPGSGPAECHHFGYQLPRSYTCLWLWQVWSSVVLAFVSAHSLEHQLISGRPQKSNCSSSTPHDVRKPDV
jgi:hypothetical protein